MTMIEVKNLEKRFGPIKAVDNISFSAEKGDVLGFLGPNGAGKSTTMRILSAFITPDRGTASIAGHDVLQDSVSARRNLGYLAENAPAYDDMTVMGLLKFVCDAREIPTDQAEDRIQAVAEQTAISAVLYQQIGTLSKGFRRRVGLAQALVHNPPVLLLDEPTDGLDPNQKHDVRNLILKLKEEKCIVISTHILEEVEQVCNRIVLISNGRLLEDTTPEELKEREADSLDSIFRKLTTAAANPAGGAK
jgi:ABC-2 type transport system ATP-binding protein